MAVPLYELIADDLRQRIASGTLQVGDALPSESQLCDQWHGSRGPIRQALAALRAEGLIGGGRGKPPIVRRQSLGQPFDTFLSFSSWAERVGRVPGQRTEEIALRPAVGDVAAALEVDVGEPVVQLLRLRLLDDLPAMIERTTFSADVGRALFDHDPDSGSIYAFLISRGLRVGVARHTIDARGADKVDAGLLAVRTGAPLLRERRVARNDLGQVFEYSDDRYRPDLVSFTIDNHNDEHSRPTLSRIPTREGSLR